MIQTAPSAEPTVWGLTPPELHARFWASRGVQVVPAGEAAPLVRHAELFLLTDPRTLVLFRVAAVLDTMDWLAPTLMVIRLRDRRERPYREEVTAGPDGRFLGFRRAYAGADHRALRVAVTTDADLARLWQHQPDARSAWRAVLRDTPKRRRHTEALPSRVYEIARPADVTRFVRDLSALWERPDAAIARVRPIGPRVWADPTADVSPGAAVVGPLWIGAGRRFEPGSSAVGPGAVWDVPAHRPPRDAVPWMDLEPLTPPRLLRFTAPPPVSLMVKRAFDVVFALLVLLVTWPAWALTALLIWLEDGRPIFFAHPRETIGGRVFRCLKFRSMRNNAEQMKAELAALNQADGPQFFIENDPRLTRVGRFIRKYQIDELPQFLNVLAGDMSVVGPRPSPFRENQFCPGWREARLSVRPGVTGLWQVSRTRVAGNDFQEWIRYDIEYVERRSLLFDIAIILRTVGMILRRFTSS